MGRHVGRSRGCKVCIQRRIKCDEATPECSQCTKSRRKCPGALQGTLFVDVTARTQQDASQSGRSDTPDMKPCRPDTVLYGTEERGQDLTALAQTINHGQVVSCLLRLPTMYQPNRGVIFQELYISHFVSSHELGLHPWILQLPDMLICPLNSNFLTGIYGIRAASMALYGKLTLNKDLELEGSKWYSKALEAQRMKLPCLTTTEHGGKDAIKGAVCSAIVSAFFESISSTSPSGWIQHLRASGRIIELAGPERCQSGLLHLFFRSVRIASVTTSIKLGEPSVFASKTWCTVPFALHPKSLQDQLFDILLQLPSCFPRRNQMLHPPDVGPGASAEVGRHLLTTTERILHRLDEFWELHKSEIDPDYDQRIILIEACLDGPIYSVGSASFPFKAPFNATLTSLFDVANVIAFHFLASVSSSPDIYFKKMTVHAASILVSLEFHESQGRFSGGSFSMLFPMRTICKMSPSSRQRAIAQEALLRWSKERGLDGTLGVCGHTSR